MALESRDRWARAAAGWEARADWFREITMPVSAWMIDAIDPQPGQTILDLAAGIGDTGFLAAELIEPGGDADHHRLRARDARRRAASARSASSITNVRFRQMDANVPLDQPAASLDGVLCRWGYMLLNDGEAALQGDPPHAQAGRQRRARRLDRPRGQPVGARSPVRILRRPRPDRAGPAGRPASSPGPSRASSPSRWKAPASSDYASRPSTSRSDYRTSTTGGSPSGADLDRPPRTPTHRWTTPPEAPFSPTWRPRRRAVRAADGEPRDPRPHVGCGRQPRRLPRHVLRRRRGPEPPRTARPWPSSATARRATRTRATSRTPGSTSS